MVRLLLPKIFIRVVGTVALALPSIVPVALPLPSLTSLRLIEVTVAP